MPEEYFLRFTNGSSDVGAGPYTITGTITAFGTSPENRTSIKINDIVEIDNALGRWARYKITAVNAAGVNPNVNFTAVWDGSGAAIAPGSLPGRNGRIGRIIANGTDEISPHWFDGTEINGPLFAIAARVGGAAPLNGILTGLTAAQGDQTLFTLAASTVNAPDLPIQAMSTVGVLSGDGTSGVTAFSTTSYYYGTSFHKFVCGLAEVGMVAGGTGSHLAGSWLVTGDFEVRGGDLTTNQTTFNLLNTVATTLNIGGAATVALNIGNAAVPADFAGGIRIGEAKDITFGTTSGGRIGDAASDKMAFWGKSPSVIQPGAIADATDAGTAISQLNLLLATTRTIGLIAT